jgi:hypothetical protein
MSEKSWCSSKARPGAPGCARRPLSSQKRSKAVSPSPRPPGLHLTSHTVAGTGLKRPGTPLLDPFRIPRQKPEVELRDAANPTATPLWQPIRAASVPSSYQAFRDRIPFPVCREASGGGMRAIASGAVDWIPCLRRWDSVSALASPPHQHLSQILFTTNLPPLKSPVPPAGRRPGQ